MINRQARRREAVDTLQLAFAERNMALYLGAGVSVASGIPPWEKLVSAMYFAALAGDSGRALKGAFRNYLMAIAEWHLNQNAEPLDITARRIREKIAASGDFREELRRTLYMPLLKPDGQPVSDARLNRALEDNDTLQAVARMCADESQGPRAHGISAVVTYNYDNLLEKALKGLRRHNSIWRASQRPSSGSLPIYHVHGCVPLKSTGGSSAKDLVFTEAQYHSTANDPFHWSNVVQVKIMSNTVGLMVGMSMKDRNVRRILDALRATPAGATIYAILPVPTETLLAKREVAEIRKSAKKYLQTFRRIAGEQPGGGELTGMKSIGMKSTGMKSLRRGKRRGRGALTQEHRQVESILNAVKDTDFQLEDDVLRSLGVTPIWIEDFREIGQIVRDIVA